MSTTPNKPIVRKTPILDGVQEMINLDTLPLETDPLSKDIIEALDKSVNEYVRTHMLDNKLAIYSSEHALLASNILVLQALKEIKDVLKDKK